MVTFWQKLLKKLIDSNKYSIDVVIAWAVNWKNSDKCYGYGVHKWLYESMVVYKISYDVYEWFMFMNGCISHWSGMSYLGL